MVKKVCLDSDVVISLVNKDQRTKEIMSSLDAIFYLTAINSFEVWVGRKKNEILFELLECMEIMVLDDKSARLAADMLRDLKKKGKMIEIRDLFIAAVCITNNVGLLTYNKKHFKRLQKYGLVLIE